MRILKYPKDSKLLRTPGKEVSKEMISTPEFKVNLQRMSELLSGEEIGLASTQVADASGVWPLSLFILIRDKELEPILPTTFINPQILRSSSVVSKDVEGCLSFDGLSLKISRPLEICWSYYIENWEYKVEVASGYYARAIMHEIDHLQGRVFIDHANKVEYATKVEPWLKMKRNQL